MGMNASRRYAIVAVAAVLMLLALGVAIGLQTPGSNCPHLLLGNRNGLV
jgi:hypothetical protein